MHYFNIFFSVAMATSPVSNKYICKFWIMYCSETNIHRFTCFVINEIVLISYNFNTNVTLDYMYLCIDL